MVGPENKVGPGNEVGPGNKVGPANKFEIPEPSVRADLSVSSS